MADIRQTNRTLLFGVINPERPDFITQCGDTRGLEALDDQAIADIDLALKVQSYAEFESKFQPVVYGYFDANGQKAVYTLKKPDSIPDEFLTITPLGIKNPTTSMMYNMLDAKGAQGTKNIDFGYENILDQISPKKVVAGIQQTRKEMMLGYAKYAALPEGDPVKDELGAKLNNLFAEARDCYNNVTSMLALAITDGEERLMLGSGDDDSKSEKIAVGVLRLQDDGALKVLAAPKPDETALALTEGENSTELAELLASDYEDTAGEDASEYVKDLVVRTFCPLAATAPGDVDLSKEAENHNAYLDMYTQAQADFIKCAKPVLEQMLGVYVFFKQYTVKGNSGMRPELLVTNCDPELLSRSTNLSRLQTYLNSVNAKTDTDKSIYFAIAPNLSFSKVSDQKEVKAVFKTSKTSKKADVISMETLSQLINVLAEYQVKVFFSFETGEDTTFDKVAREGIGAFVDRCEPLMDKEFSACAVPCLPNPTVIPKNKSGVITGNMMVTDGESVELSREQEDIRRFWISGIYIPASYLAAGITAAWQCPEFLREKFRKMVDPALPGVRFDIEAGNNSLMVTTTLAKEISGYPATVKNDINNKGFGFIFASENHKLRGKTVNHLTVYKARSLAFDGYNFEPIYQTQVAAYFERVLRQATGDNKQDNIRFFFSSNPTSQMSQWEKKKEYINAVIQIGDEISFEMDEAGNNCDIHFLFNGVSKNMRVQLQRSTAGRSA